jgi:hypothetical protein
VTTRKLTVTSQAILTTFKNSKGNDTTLYEVYAVNETGEPIELPLRAFDPLPENELIEVEVSKHTSERWGESFTLKQTGQRSPGARLGPKVDDLRGRIVALEQRVEELEARENERGTADDIEPSW